jgi:hypothetical protein
MKTLIALLALFAFADCSYSQDSLSTYPQDSNLCLHGKVYEYYSNGNPKLYRTYTHGFLYGEYAEYDKKGNLIEDGFMDGVNVFSLLMRPSKVIRNLYDKDGGNIQITQGQVTPLRTIPEGKCKSTDGNITRIRSLLIGKWSKCNMIPFDKNASLIDSVFINYSTEITFFANDSLDLYENRKHHVGRYQLESNKLRIEIKNKLGDWIPYMSWRWPKETLYPAPSGKYFNLQLLEVLPILLDENTIVNSDVAVRLRRE